MLTWLALVNAGVSNSSRRILIFSGILPVVTTPDELAALLGHELAHVLANHSKNTRSTNFVAFLASIPCIPPCLLSFLIPELLICFVPLASVAASLLYVSRKHEKEADYIGIMLMADAGFDPFAAVALWEKMKKVEDSILKSTPGAQRDPQWTSTHPYVSQHPIHHARKARADP